VASGLRERRRGANGVRAQSAEYLPCAISGATATPTISSSNTWKARTPPRGEGPRRSSRPFGWPFKSRLLWPGRRAGASIDLEPANIILAGPGAGSTGSLQAKLLDFGLAKIRPAAAQAAGLTALATAPPELTGHGSILGTFQYMAPEQLEGQDADARTDIFAFGAVLYEMLTARKAFEGKTQASLIASILDRQPPSVSSLQPTTPVALDRLLRACLMKDPADRIQSAHDIAMQLQWIAETPDTAAATMHNGRDRDC
jgi:hypothetical protein